MNDDITPELRARFVGGDPEAIRIVIDLIIERDRTLLDRLAVDD